ncbi:hypothetical protein EU545_04340 [Candidatus Thorarchaeota archaeon]|nr:MAG: hypothetical protein EU545_04340 [Candidatus Thorarchaeota archaeon]
MSPAKRESGLSERLQTIVDEMNDDRFMLMEYLGPVVDGCRAAFQMDVESARKLDKISEHEFHDFLDTAGGSFQDVAFCVTTPDGNPQFAVRFEEGEACLNQGCGREAVVISAPEDVLVEIFDIDSRFSPLEVLGEELALQGSDACEVAEALGFLSFPTLLRMARSGIDPSSLMAENADSVIMATASDLVTKLLRRWIDLQMESK